MAVVGNVVVRRKRALIIDSSTIDPNASKYLADQSSKAGLRFVDAPVSGGIGGEMKS